MPLNDFMKKFPDMFRPARISSVRHQLAFIARSRDENMHSVAINVIQGNSDHGAGIDCFLKYGGFHLVSKVIRPGAGSPDNLEEVDEFSGTEPPVMGKDDLLFQVIMVKEYYLHVYFVKLNIHLKVFLIFIGVISI